MRKKYDMTNRINKPKREKLYTTQPVKLMIELEDLQVELLEEGFDVDTQSKLVEYILRQGIETLKECGYCGVYE